jgi:hypothetical protein
MDETTWFQRFGAIPGITYATPAGIRRPEMPKRALTPERHRSDWDGKPHEWLSWHDGDGETSASPAHRWPPESDPRDPSPELVRQRLYETLELPGIASDYHFALLTAYERLRSHARSNPELYAEVEQLCLLDVDLVERYPKTIRMDEGDAAPFRVPAFGILIDLYERNGLLDEAAAMAKRAAAAGQGDEDVTRIEERVASLLAEDA